MSRELVSPGEHERLMLERIAATARRESESCLMRDHARKLIAMSRDRIERMKRRARFKPGDGRGTGDNTVRAA